MRMLKIVYDKIEKELADKEADLKSKQSLRSALREEGDLKENEEYQRVSDEVSGLASDILDLISLKEEAEIVEETDDFDVIDIGCRFLCKITSPGDALEGNASVEFKGIIVRYDQQNDVTISEQVLKIGGNKITDLDNGILSADSPLGSFLLEKTLERF